MNSSTAPFLKDVAAEYNEITDVVRDCRDSIVARINNCGDYRALAQQTTRLLDNLYRSEHTAIYWATRRYVQRMTNDGS